MNFSFSKSPFTIRAFVIGAVLSALIGVGEPFGVMWVAGSLMTSSGGAAIVILFVLVLVVNSLLKLINRKSALGTGELALIFIMMLVSCAITGAWGVAMQFIFLIAGVRYYATPGNRWGELIHSRIPSWLTPQDSEAVRTFFEGLPGGASIPWGVWMKPLFYWVSFLLILYFTMICISSIFRKQWMERERLIYPLMEVPLGMMEEERDSIIPSFFKNKLMWLGFSIPFFFQSLSALHHYFPAFPVVSFWKSIPFLGGAFPLLAIFRFEVLGIAFLLSKDVSLSLWLFSLVYFFQHLLFVRTGFSLGITDPYSQPAPPSIAFQQMGALFVFVASSFWFARSHLRDVIQKAFMNKDIDDSKEILSYRASVIGVIAGTIALIFLVKFTGFSIPASIFFVITALVIFTALSKLTCQAGTLWARSPVAPGVFAIHSLGGAHIGPGGPVAIGFSLAYSSDIQNTVMAATSQGLKAVESKGVRGRKVFLAISLGILISLACSIWAVFTIAYTHGGINCFGWPVRGMPDMAFSWAKNYIIHPLNVDFRRFLFFGLGAFLMFLLTLMRARFVWWPFHPAGAVIGYTTPIQWAWPSFFLGWLLKSLILRYGGPKAYRKLVPCFIGFIIGSFTCPALWNVIAFITGEQGVQLTF